ncbi:MAG: hypothetical protein P9L92_09780 [Candidatus Electryonea clarkiae]|nr:hypothetical protein [Candidatus Electryonea clarkiae]MDP8286388.1 hypothetical protein [Candidatus Electryonea clarkiae]
MPARFGDIVVDMDYVTEEQLLEAIQLQKKGRAKLGEIMVHLRIIDRKAVDVVVEYQTSPKGEGKRFGACALELGTVSGPKLAEAIKYQTQSKGVLGNILIDLGYITAIQRDEVIKSQLQGL